MKSLRQDNPQPDNFLTSVAIIVCFIGLLLLFNSLAHSAETDTQVVASVIAAESCGEGKEGMYLVANTIQNRAKLWHKTPLQVVTQKNQYYGLTNPNRAKIANSVPCRAYSEYLSQNIMDLPDKSNGALYFLLPNEKERKWHKQLVQVYKKHRFYR